MELTDLRADARFLISPQITSTEYADTALDRNLNLWYRSVLSWIVSVQGEWEINGDIFTRDLSTGVTDYEMPSSLFRLFKGEIMYDTTQGFVPLTPISVQGKSSVEGNSTRPIDDFTRPTLEVFGNFLQIKPAPTADVVNGLKLWAQVDFVDITTSNDTPDLIALIHRALSVGAAMDYAFAQEMWSKFSKLKQMMFGDASMPDDKGIKGNIEDLYSNRAGQREQRIIARRQNFR
jgi:hypothetical protein